MQLRLEETSLEIKSLGSKVNGSGHESGKTGSGSENPGPANPLTFHRAPNPSFAFHKPETWWGTAACFDDWAPAPEPAVLYDIGMKFGSTSKYPATSSAG